MKTSFNWKIITAFVITPFLSLSLFTLAYWLILTSKDDVPFGVYVFLTLFGILGFWSLFVLVFRAKQLIIDEDKLEIQRLFTRQKFSYIKSEVALYDIIKRSKNPLITYEILQFKTKDHKHHSIVSYEFNQYHLLKKWISNSNAEYREIKMLEFYKNEYQIPFLIAVIVFIGSLISLTS